MGAEEAVSAWPGKYVIGLTGNIATGKSVVRKMLEHLGAYGIDADESAGLSCSRITQHQVIAASERKAECIDTSTPSLLGVNYVSHG